MAVLVVLALCCQPANVANLVPTLHLKRGPIGTSLIQCLLSECLDDYQLILYSHLNNVLGERHKKIDMSAVVYLVEGLIFILCQSWLLRLESVNNVGAAMQQNGCYNANGRLCS